MERKKFGKDYFSKESIRKELIKGYDGIFPKKQLEMAVDSIYNIRNSSKGVLLQVEGMRKAREKENEPSKKENIVNESYVSKSSKKNSKPKLSIIDVNRDKFSKLVQEVYNSGQGVSGDFNFSKEYNYGGQDFKYKQKISLSKPSKNIKYLYSDILSFENQEESIDNLKNSLEFFAGEGSIAELSDFREVGKGLEGKFEIYHSPIRGSDDSSNSSGQLSLNI